MSRKKYRYELDRLSESHGRIVRYRVLPTGGTIFDKVMTYPASFKELPLKKFKVKL